MRTGVRWKLVTRSRQAQPETRTWPAYVTVSQPLGHTVAYGYKDLRFRNSLPHPIALPINE